VASGVAAAKQAGGKGPAQYGFTEVGEQWDDENGLEIIYELDV
jgi:hypothetical protein